MTEPLTPPDADLQDFAFMPLHVARLRDSDLAAEAAPEACWYAVLLWSAAWHQLPAGSLPANDAVLARLCGLGRDLKTFRKHRGDAMRGWVECSDGRLYHPVVAEQVNASWSEKLAYRDRKAKRTAIAEKAAEARWGKSGNASDADANPMHEASPQDASCIPDAMLKGRGRGTGSYSDPDGSGAAAAPSQPQEPLEPAKPVDPEKVMFDQGRAFLAEHGVVNGKAGSMLGKWKRDHGAEAVIVALGKAQREGAIDPVSFIEGCLRNGHRNHHDRSEPQNPMVRGLRNAEAREAGQRSAGVQPRLLS